MIRSLTLELQTIWNIPFFLSRPSLWKKKKRKLLPGIEAHFQCQNYIWQELKFGAKMYLLFIYLFFFCLTKFKVNEFLANPWWDPWRSSYKLSDYQINIWVVKKIMCIGERRVSKCYFWEINTHSHNAYRVLERNKRLTSNFILVE